MFSAFALAFLLPATVAALYYFVLTTLAYIPFKPVARPAAPTAFAVLVPAHNEALSLPATLRSLQSLEYQHVQICVIADNCDDDTAAVARSFGASVIERFNPLERGKGYALEYALNQILPTKPDAVLILDADGELAPDTCRWFAARLADCEVVQGSIRTRNSGDGASGLVAAIGNKLDDAVSTGRDRLGWRVPLRGSNMAFRREVLERVPWTCHGLTEDAEYGEKLRATGVRVRFEPRAKARSESPARLDVLTQQRRRWRAAITWSTLLDSKPLVLAHLLLTTVVVIAVGEFKVWLAAIWLLTCAVYLPVLEVRSLQLLPGIPRVIWRLLVVTLGRSESTWQRTRRVVEG